MNSRGRFCLRPIKKDDLAKIFTFLQAFEYGCTALSSLFAQRTKPEDPCRFTLPVRNTCFVLEVITEDQDSVIAGILSYSSSGLLYHCLPFLEPGGKNAEFLKSLFYGKDISAEDKDDLRFLCTEFFANHCASPPLSSMMGGLQSGIFLESCMPKKIMEARSCKLMSLTASPALSALSLPPDCSEDTTRRKETEILKKYKVHLCTFSDADKLSDLMTGYYIEEVLPAGTIITDKDMRLFLNQRLKKQLIFAMENENGVFEAMAATTALGIQTARLGGIYTLPESRRQGLAAVLVKHISAELLKLHYVPVLFVRTANPGAEKLYTNCGFSVCGGYRITYF